MFKSKEQSYISTKRVIWTLLYVFLFGWLCWITNQGLHVNDNRKDIDHTKQNQLEIKEGFKIIVRKIDTVTANDQFQNGQLTYIADFIRRIDK